MWKEKNVHKLSALHLQWCHSAFSAGGQNNVCFLLIWTLRSRDTYWELLYLKTGAFLPKPGILCYEQMNRKLDQEAFFLLQRAWLLMSTQNCTYCATIMKQIMNLNQWIMKCDFLIHIRVSYEFDSLQCIYQQSLIACWQRHIYQEEMCTIWMCIQFNLCTLLLFSLHTKHFLKSLYTVHDVLLLVIECRLIWQVRHFKVLSVRLTQ